VRKAIARSGADIDECEPLGIRMRLPFPLNGRRVLGRAVLVTGTRRR
jgi:hypothetical protein